MENYSELKFKLLILSLISTSVGILLGYFFGTTISLYITLGWLVPFLWFGHFLSLSIGLLDFTFGTIDGGLHMDLGWIIKFPIYIILLFNPFKNSISDIGVPVSTKASNTKKDLVQKSKPKKNSKIFSNIGITLLISFVIINIFLIIEPDLNNNPQNIENDPKVENNQRKDSDIFSNFLNNLENEDFLKQEIRILSEDLAKEPDSFNYVTRGGLYLLLKKYQSGLNDMNKALKLEPDNMDAYFYRGVIRLNMRADPGSLKVKKGCKDIKTAHKAGQQDAIYWVKDNQELLKRKKCKI